MTLWNPQYTVEDLHELQAILFNFLENLSDVGWSHKTGRREKDWTVKETVAHLLSISRLFQQGVHAARTDTPLKISNLARREDLRAFNHQEIANLSTHSPTKLILLLRKSYADVLAVIPQLTSDDYLKTVDIYVYNRPTRVMDLIDFQLTHAGIIHASQLVQGESDDVPLWRHFSNAMIPRMIDRYLRHFSYAYWNHLAGDLQGVIQFKFGNVDVQTWYLEVSPQGSWTYQGISEDTPLFTIWVKTADVLFSIFTMHTTTESALMDSQLSIHGAYPDPFALLSHFSASPPKRPLPHF